jgi:hypothetical protein
MALAPIDRFGRRGQRRARLYLDRNEHRTTAGDDDFARRAAETAGHYPISFGAQ